MTRFAGRAGVHGLYSSDVVRGLTALMVVMVAAACSGSPSTQAKVAPATSITPAPSSSGFGGVGASPTVGTGTSTGPPQREEPPLPAAVQETAAAVAGGLLYIIGGFDSAGHSTTSVFVYDRVRWSTGPRLPTALDHPAAASAGGDLYVTGGFSNGRTSAQVFRLAGDHWDEVTSLRHPRGALGLVGLGGKLYAIGGNDGNNQVAATEVFDTATGVWQDLAPLPAPRNHIASFVYQNMACVAGGRPPNVASVDCFDPTSAAWQRLASLPSATSGAGAAALADQIVVAGGENTDTNVIISQVARFQGGSWRTEAMLHPRHGIQLAVLDGRAWACGGGTKVGVSPVNVCTSIG